MDRYPHGLAASARFTISAILGFALLALVSGCATYSVNIKSAEEVQNKKVLAGRFVVYENDQRVTWGQGRFKITMGKVGGGEGDGSILEPDPEGYIYIAADPGIYSWYQFMRVSTFTGDSNFFASLSPQVTVNHDDSVVNFGTVELRFSQTTESTVRTIFTGRGQATLKINLVDDFETTRPAISSRTFGLQPIRDVVPTMRSMTRQ